MQRPKSTLASELILWLSGALLLAMAGTRLGSYAAFQSDPALFTHLFKPVLSRPSRTPLFKLEIPRLRMKVAVLEGDDDDTLALAPGHTPDSAAIGERGNAVVAGHRDIAFRKLRFIKVGDTILASGTQSYRYVVSGVRVVLPEDLSVLAQTPESRLTLITCYPFYFVGNAPKRFVVQAKKVG